MTTATIATIPINLNSNHLSVHQWIRSAIRDSQQPTSPIGFLFPHLPVRVVRFYFIRAVVLLLVLLLRPPPPVSPVCTAGPQPGTFPAQCAPLDLNLGPAQLSVHRWTSTWDLPSSVGTAGPQPGTFPGTAGPQPGTCPAQCAPLDLNLQPSHLSVHCWTSTWDLPSSVRTAGPQRPDRMSDRMPGDMPDKMP